MKIFWKAFLFTGLILYLSLIPSDTFPKVGVVNFDKFVHFAIYYALTFLYILPFYRKDPDNRVKFLLLPFLISTFIGGGIELLQGTSLIGRHSDWMDMAANTLGTIAALFTFGALRKILDKWNLLRLL